MILAKVARAREAFERGMTKPLAWRRYQLQALIRMLDEQGTAIEEAVAADLGRSHIDVHLSDVGTTKTEARLALRRLRSWTRDRRVRTILPLAPAHASIHREPLGTVLIISPWNYPVCLLLVPLVGAIAAGNSVVLKPSELAPTTAALLARIVPQYLDLDAVQVVEGGVEETTLLLAQRFDHIFYTGNGDVGRIVMKAAAEHLTPVTLELGGKSPVWVDDSFPLRDAAKWLAWGKFANCGQACVAPDYVLTTPDLVEPLAEAVASEVTRLYGDDPAQSPDYGRIVNQRHVQRLTALLSSGRAVCGGTARPDDRFVAPTVLVDVALDSPVMQDEIFGPILPIVSVPSHRDALDIIRERPKPLAMYAFTTRREVKRDLRDRTSSGGLVFGATLLHLSVPTLPFGGVGASGMGAYHGEHSMETFSHERAVLTKGRRLDLVELTRPPMTAKKASRLRRG